MTVTNKIYDAESVWGGLYLPENIKDPQRKGLRVVVFGSAFGGQLIFESLIRVEKRYPKLLNLVGLVTDDPVDPRAKISLKKRIWNNYTQAESSVIMNKLVSTSLNAGIPCFTGKVKTDYFRKIYIDWNPDVLIMNCFGQKLDSFLYAYPPLGAYNFHPSNLACNIGIGAQPFQDIMHNGLDTSPIVIHKVTEIIDAGPIVGISPEINIRLQNGKYPDSILSLLVKMNSITGWMTIDLIFEIMQQKYCKHKRAVAAIDFEKKIPDTVKELLLAPATNDLAEEYTLPLHPKIS